MHHILFVLELGAMYVLASENMVNCIPANDSERGQLTQLTGAVQLTLGSFTDSQECGTTWGSGSVLTSGDTAVTLPDGQVFPGAHSGSHAPSHIHKQCEVPTALKEIPNQDAGEMSVSEMAASPAGGLKFVPQHPSQKSKTKQTKNTCL